MKQKREDVWTAGYLVHQGTLTNRQAQMKPCPFVPEEQVPRLHICSSTVPPTQGCHPRATQWMDMAFWLRAHGSTFRLAVHP